jgi:hypothetical protein
MEKWVLSDKTRGGQVYSLLDRCCGEMFLLSDCCFVNDLASFSAALLRPVSTGFLSLLIGGVDYRFVQ